MVYFIKYAYAIFPPPLSVLYWRGEFLLCTVHGHPPPLSVWGGRFEYKYYYMLYGIYIYNNCRYKYCIFISYVFA